MKLSKTLWAIFLASGLVFTSCSDDDADDSSTNEPTVQPLENGIEVEIDGVSWRGDINQVIETPLVTQLNAIKANSNYSLQIFIPRDSINTFNIPTSVVTVALRRNTKILSDNPVGTMLLTTNDSTAIKGSFSCYATSFSSGDTLVLTNGLIDYTF
tara:strand:+ start:6051 stop:6518 length:468 start_codon:yes stop_codon:yes gene_type:complete